MNSDDAQKNNLNAGAFKIPFPEGEDGDPELVTGSPDGFMISKSCKNPEVAIEFLKLMTSKPWAEEDDHTVIQSGICTGNS